MPHPRAHPGFLIGGVGVGLTLRQCINYVWLLVSGEGPRSRRYGRTAAFEASCATLWWWWWWLLLLLFLVLFLVMEHRWNEIGRGKSKYSGKNVSQCHFVHHKSHMDTRNRTRASAVGGQRLMAWTMARPCLNLKNVIKSYLNVTWHRVQLCLYIQIWPHVSWTIWLKSQGLVVVFVINVTHLS
jgi:hypothetical protein